MLSISLYWIYGSNACVSIIEIMFLKKGYLFKISIKSKIELFLWSVLVNTTTNLFENFSEN